jgi:hypothetical protein
MKYIPVHKKTGQRYPAITEEERQRDWGRPPYSQHFRFEPVVEAAKPAPAPLEAKKVTAPEKPTEEKNWVLPTNGTKKYGR